MRRRFAVMSKRARVVYLLLVTLLSHIYVVQVSECHFCTASVCQLCCRATQEGCVNSFPSFSKGALMSNHFACEQCNCENPQIGCGWFGRRFKRVECTSCDILDSMIEVNPDLSVSGCGRVVVDGALIYTS